MKHTTTRAFTREQSIEAGREILMANSTRLCASIVPFLDWVRLSLHVFAFTLGRRRLTRGAEPSSGRYHPETYAVHVEAGWTSITVDHVIVFRPPPLATHSTGILLVHHPYKTRK
jgi:hypothetical protein